MAATLVVAVGTAGCGNSSGPGVARVAGAKAASTSGSTAGGDSGGPSANRSSGPPTGGPGGSSATIAGGGDPKKMVAFAHCMRSHGVPSFPDPSGGRIELHATPGSALNPNSPQFKAASKACRSLMPQHEVSPAQAAEAQAQALKFSVCMRAHGVPKFPDPVVSGAGIQLTIKQGSGIEPNSPQFQAAQKTCQSLMPAGGPAAKGAP